LPRSARRVLPPAFTETLLELPDDAAQAAKSGKRLLLYFGQQGCPYCKELMSTSFTQKDITDKLAKHFVAIGFDLFGDREVTWFDGKVGAKRSWRNSSRCNSRRPCCCSTRRAIIARINGYYPPHRFSAALDYSAQRLEKKLDFAAHMQTVPQTGASATLNEQPFFMKPPHDLRRKAGGKPLAVLFESRHCAPCDELHKEGFKREATRAAMARFDIARFAIAGRDPLTTPQGKATTAEAWAGN
jgi:thioredoxin-related protein